MEASPSCPGVTPMFGKVQYTGECYNFDIEVNFLFITAVEKVSNIDTLGAKSPIVINAHAHTLCDKATY